MTSPLQGRLPLKKFLLKVRKNGKNPTCPSKFHRYFQPHLSWQRLYLCKMAVCLIPEPLYKSLTAIGRIFFSDDRKGALDASKNIICPFAKCDTTFGFYSISYRNNNIQIIVSNLSYYSSFPFFLNFRKICDSCGLIL